MSSFCISFILLLYFILFLYPLFSPFQISALLFILQNDFSFFPLSFLSLLLFPLCLLLRHCFKPEAKQATFSMRLVILFGASIMCRGEFRVWQAGSQGECASECSLASEELLTVCSFNLSQTEIMLGNKT